MKLFNLKFASPELDLLVLRWSQSQATHAEVKELKALLLHDTRFREEFCEWIKAIRGKTVE